VLAAIMSFFIVLQSVFTTARTKRI
jgi:hypothetical protein